MKAKEGVINILNKILTADLTAINQYFVHEDDRHRKEMEMGDFRQLTKGHRLPECDVRSSIVFSDALRRESRHAMRPKKREAESHEHQQQEQRVQHPNMAIGIAQPKFLVEVSHAGTGSA